MDTQEATPETLERELNEAGTVSAVALVDAKADALLKIQALKG